MKLFTCTDHDSVWVGGASVVIAVDEEQARHLLDKALTQRILDPKKPYTLKEHNLNVPMALILREGDY